MIGWINSAVGLLKPYAAPPAGIQYVGGRYEDLSSVGAGGVTVSMAGLLTGGMASSPAAGDFCIISYSQAGTADRTNRTIANAAGSFTSLMTQYVNDTNDTSITIRYKFLESPIDFDVIYGTPSSSGNGVVANIQVFRGVNVATPLDVAHAVNGTINTGMPDPPSITPITSGAVIGVFGAGAFGSSISVTYTSSDFDAFSAQPLSYGGRSHAAAFGRKAWASGAFDAATFGGGSVNVADSSIAVAFALRPA